MEYKQEFDKIAFKTISEPLSTKKHVCDALNISRETLELWIQENESFKAAIDTGFIKGEVSTRDRLKKLAVRNPFNVNTKILLTMAEDVYKIGSKENQEISLTIKQDESLKDITDEKAIEVYRDIMGR